MYRTVEDFMADWSASSKGTLKVMQAITEEKKDTAIVEGHNSLEWLSWHLVSVASAFGHFAKLQIPGPGRDMKIPGTMAEIISYYEAVINAYATEVPEPMLYLLSKKPFVIKIGAL